MTPKNIRQQPRAEKSAAGKTAAPAVPNVQLRRCLAIVKALTRNRYGLTKSEILDCLNEADIPAPSDRTFVRDISELKAHGYDISCDGADFRYKLDNRDEAWVRGWGDAVRGERYWAVK